MPTGDFSHSYYTYKMSTSGNSGNDVWIHNDGSGVNYIPSGGHITITAPSLYEFVHDIEGIILNIKDSLSKMKEDF